MNKTLSQYKPHERDSVLEMGQAERERFLSVLNDDPKSAAMAQTKIASLRAAHHQELEQQEKYRYYREMQDLASASDLAYYRAKLQMDAYEQELLSKYQEKMSQVLEIQQTEAYRLEYKLNAQHPRKVYNREYLQLMKEYDKLMKLKEFEKAAQIKDMAGKMEFRHFNKLVNEFDDRNDMLTEQLTTRQQRELFILEQQFYQQKQNFEKHRKQALFEIMQSCKNDKRDMENAFSNEFIGYKQRCMDQDIVVNRRTQSMSSTFKGSQKKNVIIAELKAE